MTDICPYCGIGDLHLQPIQWAADPWKFRCTWCGKIVALDNNWDPIGWKLRLRVRLRKWTRKWSARIT